MQDATTLLFVTALQAEAQPLIQHYSLKHTDNRGFHLYGDGTIQLIITGIGKLNAAAATAHALSRLNKEAIVMNVGIAGSDQPTGSMFHAHSISDGNKVIYPSLPFVRKIPGIRVETVDQPSTAYQRNIAYDMEAAAVVATARRYVSAEFAHCLKIISDNPDNCLYDRDGSLNRSLINPNSINDLVERNIPGITEFSNTVQHLTTKLPSTISLNDDHEDLLNTLLDNTNTLRMESRPGTDRKPLHVTASQTQQLTALCARHSVLNREIPSKLPDEALANTRSLIVFLENHLSDAYPEYPQHTDDKITSKDAPPTSDV